MCSYFFYCSLDASFVSLLIISTIITWLSGLIISKTDKHSLKLASLIIGTVLNLSFLLIFKYADFFMSLTSSEKRFNLLLPVGISFYTFQSLTYIFDIYRGELKHEKNIFKYALFVSFFPLILSGPIERAKNLIPRLSDPVSFDTDRARDGLKMMLFGYFLKIVIVARMAILTDYVFSDYLNQNGLALLLAILAYTMQIYCDFAGYSQIAIGMCKIMGIDIMQNFNQPYLALSVSDFWRRWHISLSSWFRDYLYIPLGGNRKGRLRKYINIMIVFLVSGLWHGANMTFVFWGGLNGLYQVVGDLCKPIKNKLSTLLTLDKRPGLLRSVQTLVTFLLISFSWVYFRASSVYEANDILRNMLGNLSYVNLFDGTIWNVGLGVKNMLVAIAAVIILIFSDILCERKHCDPSGLLVNTKPVIRWTIYYLMILMILFSMNLNMTEFIYSNF